MILLTGAAGFIGSVLWARLAEDGLAADTVVVDDFSPAAKKRNHAGKIAALMVARDALGDWLDRHGGGVRLIVHIGARTDTMEQDARVFDELNVRPTQALWTFAARRGVPFVFASSAAVYGGGEHGFSDSLVDGLRPLNAYGRSKLDVDRWVLAQREAPPYWAGLRFFNVYGPNEAHKGAMASVAFHGHRQIAASGRMKLFRSHRPDVADGAQQRDFIYAYDVADVVRFFMNARPASGFYNVGTGRARTFNALAAALFSAVRRAPNVEWIDTPASIRDAYQYFTEADVTKLRAAGYARPFTELEDGVAEYVREYLEPDRVV